MARGRDQTGKRTRRLKMVEYLIIGNGVAGATAAENIRKNEELAKVTMVTDEDTPFYYRIRLNEYISGELSEQALQAKKDQWYEDLKIRLLLNTRIIGADTAKGIVTTEKGDELPYDKLLIASGSYSFIPPITGSDKKGVFSIRNIQDARNILAYAKDIKEVVIIGGGLLGLETGNALRKLNKAVTVVEFFPRLLPRQLDEKGAGRLQSIMEGMGFKFKLGAKTEATDGDASAKAVRLAGGELIPAGMVIVSAGVRPDMALAKAMGIECDKGVIVDEYLRTNLANIYAAGDVTEFKGMPYGIWPAAMDQGKIAGINMAGGEMVYNGTTMANTLKVVGIDLASAGEIDAEGKHEAKISVTDTTYKKIVFDNLHIIGCIMLGDTSGFNKVTRAITEKKDISAIKAQIFSGGFDLGNL
jgi:nitrite reductase (NADH) large subunit